MGKTMKEEILVALQQEIDSSNHFTETNELINNARTRITGLTTPQEICPVLINLYNSILMETEEGIKFTGGQNPFYTGRDDETTSFLQEFINTQRKPSGNILTAIAQHLRNTISPRQPSEPWKTLTHVIASPQELTVSPEYAYEGQKFITQNGRLSPLPFVSDTLERHDLQETFEISELCPRFTQVKSSRNTG